MEMRCQLHAPAALSLGKKHPALTEHKTVWALVPFWTQKVSFPYQELNHDSSAVRPLA